MGGVVKGLEKVVQSMDLEKVRVGVVCCEVLHNVTADPGM